MDQLYIPHERAKALVKSRDLLKIERASSCSIKSNDSLVTIDGDPYEQLLLKNVIAAYGNGFDADSALLLMNDDCYMSVIDIELYAKNGSRAQQLKARIIGENGKTKRYIERVSSAKISVYDDHVCVIGESEAIDEAEAAIYSLLKGEKHKTAYSKMEAAHRKNKAARKSII